VLSTHKLAGIAGFAVPEPSLGFRGAVLTRKLVPSPPVYPDIQDLRDYS